MLRKKDKEAIRQLFREELAAALTRTLMIERGPRTQDDPEEKRIVEENWNVLDYMTSLIPYIEGALRGMQATLDLQKNNIDRNNAKLEAVGQALLDMEQSARMIAALSDRLRTLGLTAGDDNYPVLDYSDIQRDGGDESGA